MNDQTPGSAPWPRWRKLLLGLLIAIAVGGLIFSQLPRGAFPTDLSRIGAGRPALVLAHDSNYAGGTAVMELLNGIRGDYADRVEFLVAHLGIADAREFASRHDADDGTVLLFTADGRRVKVLHRPENADELRQALAQAFGF
jgi:hypothetical protein